MADHDVNSSPPRAEGDATSERVLPDLVAAMLDSYQSDPRGHHLNRRFLPSRDEIVAILELLLQALYPGYFGRQDLTDDNVHYHVGVLLSTRGRSSRGRSSCASATGGSAAARSRARTAGTRPTPSRCASFAASLA